MQIEIANRISKGRAVGTDYVVTRRNETPSNSGIIARFPTRNEAVQYIVSATNGHAHRCRQCEPGYDLHVCTVERCMFKPTSDITCDGCAAKVAAQHTRRELERRSEILFPTRRRALPTFSEMARRRMGRA